MKLFAAVVVGIYLAMAIGAAVWVVDRLPPFPTCAGLGGGCGSN